MTALTFSLFGSPRIERDGSLVPVDTRKATALLAYVAVTGHPQSRDVMAALLWPDHDQDHARAALRRTLSSLKRALGDGPLEITRSTVDIAPDTVEVDVLRFHRLIERANGSRPASECIRPLTEAVRLYRDDFMAGFSLRDSLNFEDWQFFMGEELRRDLAGALERLVDCHTRLGAFEQAIEHARRRLLLDPLHEPAHRRLMLLLAWTGDRGGALKAYRVCVSVLEKELGVPPLEETTELYQAIKEDRVPPPESRPAPDPLPPQVTGHAGTRSYPLVGRSEERATLLATLASIGADGRVVVVQGEAGIGKTRLVESFLEAAIAAGSVIASVRCFEDERDLAYGPISEGLRAALTRDGAIEALQSLSPQRIGEAARLVPELAEGRADSAVPPPLGSPGSQARFFEGISRVLAAGLKGAAPGVLSIDDVQWADDASLEVLNYLVHRLEGRPLLVVLAWRDEEMPGEHSLRRVITQMVGSGRGVILSLSRFSRAEVDELIGHATSQAAEGLGDRLYQETEGLPFFLTEYLAAIDSEESVHPDGEWSLPRGVREVLNARLAGVTETGWQILTTAAAIGRSFDFDTVRDGSGRSDEETVVALEELMHRGLIEELSSLPLAPTARYDFRHEKVRALVYEETNLARRRLLHRRVADALATRARSHRDPDSLSGLIAHHLSSSGRELDAARYYQQAGDHARSLYANSEARSHYSAALGLGHPLPSALHESLGDVHTLLGDYASALASYETAAALCPPQRLAVVEHKLGNLHHRRGHWELADSYFEEAMAALGKGGDGALRARILADRSLTAHHRGDNPAASRLALQSLKWAQSSQDAASLAQAHNVLGMLATSAGDFQRAHEHLDQSLRLAEGFADPTARVAALNNSSLAHRSEGNLTRALELAEEALALCASQGDRHREAALHNNVADLLHRAQQPEQAMEHLKEAVKIFVDIGEPGEMEPEIWKLVEW